MKANQITKAIENKTYSFHARFIDKEDAREMAKKLNGKKHAYYTSIMEKGVKFYDVRTQN